MDKAKREKLENEGYKIIDSAKFHQYYGDLCEREEVIQKERDSLTQVREKYQIPLGEFIVPISFLSED